MPSNNSHGADSKKQDENMHAPTHVQAHTQTHARAHVRTHTSAHTQTYTSTHATTPTHVRTRTHATTHVQTRQIKHSSAWNPFKKTLQEPRFRQGYTLPDFLRDDAFALNSAVQNSTHALSETCLHIKSRKRVFRIKCLLLFVLIALVMFFSLGLGFSGISSTTSNFYSPLEAWQNLFNWALYKIGEALSAQEGQFSGKIFGVQVFAEGASLSDVAPLYAQVTQRAGLMLTTCVCGALLSCAGMLYQVVFRNPIVSPSLLGVTHGVQVGLLFVFAGYGALAIDMLPERFIYGYIGGAVALAVVFVLSKIITKRKTNISVFDILVIGTIVSAFLGALREYLLDVLSALNLWVEFFEYQEALNIYYDPLTYIVLIASALVSFLPIVAMRYRMNLLVFSDGEIVLLGGNPRVLRACAILAGSLMILTAQVFLGSASCFALVIPFLVRYIFGSEFSGQLWGCVLVGALVLVVCRVITALIPFVGVGLPIGAVAGAITLPIFVWASALSRRGW